MLLANGYARIVFLRVFEDLKFEGSIPPRLLKVKGCITEVCEIVEVMTLLSSFEIIDDFYKRKLSNLSTIPWS